MVLLPLIRAFQKQTLHFDEYGLMMPSSLDDTFCYGDFRLTFCSEFGSSQAGSRISWERLSRTLSSMHISRAERTPVDFLAYPWGRSHGTSPIQSILEFIITSESLVASINLVQPQTIPHSPPRVPRCWQRL